MQYKCFEWHVSKIFELKIKLKSLDFLNLIKKWNIPNTNEIIESLSTKQTIIDNWYIPISSMEIDWKMVTIHDICKILDGLVKMRLWSSINKKINRIKYFAIRIEINSAVYVLSKYNKMKISKIFVARIDRNTQSYTKNNYFSIDKIEICLNEKEIYFDMNSVKNLAINNFCEICKLDSEYISDPDYIPINLKKLVCKICYSNIADIRLNCFLNNKYGHRICKSCFDSVSLCPFCRKPLERYHVVHYETSNIETSIYVLMIIVLYYTLPEGILIFTLYWWLSILFFYYKRYFKNLFRIMNLSDRKKRKYEEYLAMLDTCDIEVHNV